MDRDPARQAFDVDAAFRAVFDENFGFVWNALRRLGVAEADRGDVANEVFFRVYQAMNIYDPARPARPWLFAFAARVASEHRRRAHHRSEVLGDTADAAAPSSAPENALERAEQRAILAEALDALDDEKRAAFVMHDLEEMTTADIASAFGVPEGTVSSRIRAARAQLTDAVRRIRARARKGTP